MFQVLLKQRQKFIASSCANVKAQNLVKINAQNCRGSKQQYLLPRKIYNSRWVT